MLDKSLRSRAKCSVSKKKISRGHLLKSLLPFSGFCKLLPLSNSSCPNILGNFTEVFDARTIPGFGKNAPGTTRFAIWTRICGKDVFKQVNCGTLIISRCYTEIKLASCYLVVV